MIKKTSFFLYFFVLTFFFHAQPYSNASRFFEMGMNSFTNENWYEASQYFMEAVNLNSAYSEAWFYLAQCSFQLGEFELSLKNLEHAEKYSKNDSAILNLRGMNFIALGKFDEAASCFETVLKKYPNNTDARFGLAELDLFNGRISGAQSKYSEILKRDVSSRKALLSLALIAADQGKKNAAKRYLEQALSHHSNEAFVHYAAAVVYYMNSDMELSQKHCNTAIELDSDYDRAYELLAKIKYVQGLYSEVISLCEARLLKNRLLPEAYYLKGWAFEALGREADSINAWSLGVKIDPENEVMRAALELSINKYLPLEDSRREQWADYHIKAAREFLRRYDRNSAMYEYKRALKIQPSNTEARKAYAQMLSLAGMNELYLDQLLFIKAARDNLNKEKSLSDIMLDDKIEAYTDLLSDALSKKWNVQPFFLDKTRYKIAVYYKSPSKNTLHIESDRLAAEFAADMFSGVSVASVVVQALPVNSFGEAYQKSRSDNMDYFIFISMQESSRDITLTYDFYSAKTGIKLETSSIYGTANHRYASVFRRFRNEILEILPIRAQILNRDGKTLLADIGKSENIKKGSVFDVVRKNSILIGSESKGLKYADKDILGTFTITETGEEISEGILEYKGFYDRVNTGDELVLISIPENNSPEGSVPINETSPAADTNGNAIQAIKPGLIAEDFELRKPPTFIDLIRSIY